MIINERIQKIVDDMFQGNKARFANAIGMPPTSVSNYIGKQRASKPSADMLEKIVSALDVDAKWLLTGDILSPYSPLITVSASRCLRR